MSRSTISTLELFQMFPDAESARAYFKARRWPDGAVCPACSEAKRIGTRKDGFYRCNRCLADFTVRTGTIFERSKIPLHVWAAALVLVAEKPAAETSSTWLAGELGLTQKTAWLVLRRIRNATLTDAQIAAIRGLKGKMLQREIAARFGTTQAYVSDILSNRRRALA